MTKTDAPKPEIIDRRKRLAELEQAISRDVGAFLRVGQALLEVRDAKLYAETHPTFEAWANEHFQMSRRTAYDLINAIRVRDNLVRHGAQTLPANERQGRELAKLDEETQAKVWGEAVELGDGDPTEKHVKAAIRERNRQQRVADLANTSRGNTELGGIGPYSVILADCPWQYDGGTADPTREIENQYPTMPIAEIMALGEQVKTICTADAVLFLWVPETLIFSHGGPTIEAWGFKHKSGYMWDKEMMGMGYWARGQHEHLFVCVRGNPPKPKPSSLVSSVIRAKRTKHSEKPVRVHEIIEQYYPELAKVELFARAARKSWARWGNQA